MFRLALIPAAALVAAPAFAGGDVPQPALPPVVVPVAAEQDWTGFYAGGQIDLATPLSSENEIFGFIADYDGTLGGVFAGYRHDLGDIVVGAEFDYMFGGLERGEIGSMVAFLPGTETPDMRLARFGAEIGYDLGDVLVYGTAGLAHISVDFNDIIDTQESGGFFYGLGVDYRVSENVTIGAELLQHRFDDFDVAPTTSYDLTTIGLNVAFTF